MDIAGLPIVDNSNEIAAIDKSTSPGTIIVRVFPNDSNPDGATPVLSFGVTD